MSDVRVFVVDDNAAFRQTMAAVVDEVPGFRLVGEAASAEESMTVLSEVAADLVLMDVNLPGMSGVEAARQLTAGPNGPVVILVSTYDESEVDYSACGASAYITKASLGPERLAQVWPAVIDSARSNTSN